MFGSIYKGTRTLVTGHTGFKGSWLQLWLERLGSEVSGYSLAPNTEPNHVGLLALSSPESIADICDIGALAAHIERTRPEIVFHLAAQASVLYSYDHPLETFATNVMGTANLLEVCRRSRHVRAVVVVTTDKCYENREWAWGYRENDRLGGHDPYSASKSCAELVAASYSRAFGSGPRARAQPLLIATARGGNVLGGGDWTRDRLIPDAVRATARRETLHVRNPSSSRPWQHVLDLSAGYLLLGWRLLEGRSEFAEPWNFGPSIESNLTVAALVSRMQAIWPELRVDVAAASSSPHEAKLLMVDSTKARQILRWSPVWDIDATLRHTAEWYRTWLQEQVVSSARQLDQFVEDAVRQEIVWAQ